MAHPVANHRVYDLLDALEQQAVLNLMHEIGCEEDEARQQIFLSEAVTQRWVDQCERQVQHVLAMNTKGLTLQSLGR